MTKGGLEKFFEQDMANYLLLCWIECSKNVFRGNTDWHQFAYFEPSSKLNRELFVGF